MGHGRQDLGAEVREKSRTKEGAVIDGGYGKKGSLCVAKEDAAFRVLSQ